MLGTELIGRLVEVLRELSNGLGVVSESCVRRSCAAGDLPACAGVDVSWTPPWVSNTLSKCHKGIPCRASGLVQIACALIEPQRVTRRVALPCACQRHGGRCMRKKNRKLAVSQNRSEAAGFGSRESRCPYSLSSLIRGGTTSSLWSNSSLGIAPNRACLNRAVVLQVPPLPGIPRVGCWNVNQRLAAVRRLAYEAADSGLLSPELAAGIRRVKGCEAVGDRMGNWLSQRSSRAASGKCRRRGSSQHS